MIYFIKSNNTLRYTFKKMVLMCIWVFIQKKRIWCYFWWKYGIFTIFRKKVLFWPNIYDGPLPTRKKKFFFRVKRKIENFRSFSFVCSKWIANRITSVKYRDFLQRQISFFPKNQRSYVDPLLRAEPVTAGTKMGKKLFWKCKKSQTFSKVVLFV